MCRPRPRLSLLLGLSLLGSTPVFGGSSASLRPVPPLRAGDRPHGLVGRSTRSSWHRLDEKHTYVQASVETRVEPDGTERTRTVATTFRPGDPSRIVERTRRPDGTHALVVTHVHSETDPARNQRYVLDPQGHFRDARDRYVSTRRVMHLAPIARAQGQTTPIDEHREVFATMHLPGGREVQRSTVWGSSRHTSGVLPSESRRLVTFPSGEQHETVTTYVNGRPIETTRVDRALDETGRPREIARRSVEHQH